MSHDALTIDEIREADLEEVADFLERQTLLAGFVPTPSHFAPARRLRWLLVENPSRNDGIPFGWCVRSPAGVAAGTAAGTIVGAMICVPFRFATRAFACTAAMVCKFYMDKAHRRGGMGSGMLARYLALGQRFPLFATSANAASGALFERSGGYRIAGTDPTMLRGARG